MYMLQCQFLFCGIQHVDCGISHIAMLKNILLLGIFVFCAPIASVTGDCAVQNTWKYVSYLALLIFCALHSPPVLLLWSGG